MEASALGRIGAMLAEGGLEPTPTHYEFLYRYVTGVDPQLSGAVDALLAAGRRLDARAVATLRRDLYGLGGAGVGQLLEDTGRQLARMTDYVGRSDADARQYREQLGRTAIDTAATLERQRAMLAEMVDATNAMIAQTEVLQEELVQSSRQIDMLKADLEIARVESRLDALTGLANRKACCDYLDAQIARAGSERGALGLIFLDIDHFKSFNDTHGHRMGDEVLRLVSQSLERFFHGAGFVSRWGGEEFVVVMPGHTQDSVVDFADRFRREIGARRLRARASGREVGRLTLSLGVAGLETGDSAQALIDRADSALYDAKAEGRDRVVRWREAA